jgi:hypothetical protein
MKHLLFTIYATKVGTKTEFPISKVITEAEEEAYRDFQYSREWNAWADRNRIYRNVRIEVTPVKKKR